MIANHIKRIWLYALVIIGILLIFWSFFNLYSNYQEQKTTDINLVLKHIQFRENFLNDAIFKYKEKAKNQLLIISKTPFKQLIDTGNNSINSPINGYLDYSSVSIQSLVILNKDATYICGYYKNEQDRKNKTTNYLQYSDVLLSKKSQKAKDSLNLNDSLFATYYLTYQLITLLEITLKTLLINHFEFT